MGNGSEAGFSMVWIGVGFILTWVILAAAIVLLARFYSKYQETKRELDLNLLNIADQVKKIHITLKELLTEQHRISRLTLEQLDLKRAEMTGDFEIVEEPIPPAGASAEQEPAVPEKRPPSKFPEIKFSNSK